MPKKRNWEEVRNNTSERPTLLNRFKKSSKKFIERIKDTFKPLPSNKEAWNSFPEEAKKEMLESLKMKDSVNLYWIDLTKIIELEPSIKWGEDLIFKKWAKKQDSIWEYIEINWHKCRAYQRGISWFAYKDINSRYNPFELFEIWFYEEWIPKNFVIIDLSLKPQQLNIPNWEKLWWPFFIKNDESSIGKDSPLYNISPHDISQYPSRENKDTLTIKWTTFEPFKPGITWFVYYCFDSLNRWNTKMTNIFLAEYKNWEMIWEWVIMTWVKEGIEPTSSKEYDIINFTSGK